MPMNFEQAIRQVQDTLIGMAEIQGRQAEVKKAQAGEAAQQAQFLRRLHEGMNLHEQRMHHLDLTLSEIGDKLNGLLGFMGGFFEKPK